MGFIEEITKEYRKLKTWKKTLNDAVKRKDSELLISMLSNPDFESGYNDILLKLGNFDDKEVIDILYNTAMKDKEEELRENAIKALFEIAERQNKIYDKLSIILENELDQSNPSEDILDIYLYVILFDQLSMKITNIFLDKFIETLKEDKLPGGNIKNLISIFGELKRKEQLPFILKKKQNDFFKNSVNIALKKIGYKHLIQLIETELDSNVKKMAINELRYIRINCEYNERVKDWDLTEEEALVSLVKALTDSNRSIQISAINSIGCYGEFAIEAVSELEPFLDSEDKTLRIIAEKAIRQIISRDKVEAKSLIEHYGREKTSEKKKSLFEFNKENMYFITMILSFIMNMGFIIKQFFILSDRTEQIIGYIIIGFLGVLILILLGISINNWKRKREFKSKT